MVVALLGTVAGGTMLFRYLQDRQFSDANTSATFVDMDPINVSIVKDGEIMEIRTYTFVVETRAGGPHSRVTQNRPKLRETYMMYLNALAQRRGPENIDNLDYVRLQLTRAGTDLLGPKVVYSVLIKSFLTRPPTTE
jgi:hypothetical protein